MEPTRMVTPYLLMMPRAPQILFSVSILRTIPSWKVSPKIAPFLKRTWNVTRPSSRCCLWRKDVSSFSRIGLFIYYVYNVLPACMPSGQKRTPDLITDGCEPPYGCCELNSGPLEEQPVLLTSEPSLQPPSLFFISTFPNPLFCSKSPMNSTQTPWRTGASSNPSHRTFQGYNFWTVLRWAGVSGGSP
ncbi:hypothetical protein LEMLEM_LOCUS16408 [Lemmus lemmus]